jgi:hypothetical protein
VADIHIEIPDRAAALLDVLIDPDEGLPDRGAVVERLIDHAQQGVYRPGAWERSWLMQAFGASWLARLEPDTGRTAADGRIIFDRPRKMGQKYA